MGTNDLQDQLNNLNRMSGQKPSPLAENPNEAGLRLTRIDVSLPATYTLKDQQYEGTIVNISSGGVAMEVRQIFVVGDILRIQFKLPANKLQAEVDFWAIVKNVSHGMVGLKFEELSHEMEHRLEEYVNDMLRARGLSHHESY